ncbi:MAG: SDR family oxidoreductase [Chloroflexi bacterium]|nr:SDR family oxidoreductase [Chloroflexota bacterium]
MTGASRGMGRATSLLLAAAGADLVMTYRERRDAGEDVLEQVRAVGRDALLMQCDAGVTESVEAVVANAQRQFGHIDILVSNAGAGTRAALTETTDQEYQRVFDVNVKGFLAAARRVVPAMQERRWGRVIAIGSATGQSGRSYLSPSPPVYAAAKAALAGMCRALARECGPYGITVNCIQPGLTRNDGTARADPARVAYAVQETPLGRIGEPEDIAGAVLFLASDYASYITGSLLNVNGGLFIG